MSSRIERSSQPKFPESPYRFEMEVGILTGPPWSEGSILPLVGPSCILCWRLDSKEWRFEYLRYKTEICAFVVFDGKIYFLDDNYRVKVATLNPPMTWRTLELGLPTRPELRGNFSRLDFEGVKWEKVDDLGDWCLFVDVERNCPIASSNPSRWGGRSNSIYLAGPGHYTLAVFPLDGSVIDAVANRSAVSTPTTYSRWPSPMWVCISKLLSRR